MATREQREALLAVRCGWCGAAPHEECSTGPAGDRRLITTLDGGCHDARWRAALGVGAPVIAHDERGHEQVAVAAPAAPEREPVSVGAALAERPW